MALSYLYPPCVQFQSQAGVNNTAGFLRVFYTQTDDRAVTYSDFGGTENEADIVLDSNGRAVVIVDDTKTYRLEVYNRNRGLMFTCDPITAQGGGGGGGNVAKIVSTDGTVAITVSSGGGIITYDLSTALTNRASDWGNGLALRSSITGDQSWEEVQVISTTGTSVYSNGWTASKDTAYDLAASLEMPTGDANAICMLDVRFDVEVDGSVVKSEYGSIDPSRGMDRVSFEWKGGVNQGQVVNGRLFVRCAEPLSLGLIGTVLFNEECDGIVGTGGGGGASYIAGQYVDINTANVISVTGLQPAGNYVYKNEISAQSSLWNTVSGKEDQVNWGLSGNTITSINGHVVNGGGGVTYSAGNYVDIDENDVISVTGLQPSGDYAYNSAVSSKVDQSAFDDCCSSVNDSITSITSNTSYISSVVSGITGATGNYVEKSSISAESSMWNTVSGKQDSGNYLSSTDSALFQPAGSYLSSTDASSFYPSTSNPSGYLTGLPADLVYSADLSAYQPSGNYQTAGDYVQVSAISAESAQWNEVSGLSGKLDNSASSTFYPMTGNPSSFITINDVPTGSGHMYTGIAPIVVDNTADTISVDCSGLSVDGTMVSYISGNSIVIGVNGGALDLTSYQKTADMSAYQTTAGMGAYQLTADMSSYDAVDNVVISNSSTWNKASSISGYVPYSADTLEIGSGNSVSGTSMVQGKGNKGSGNSFVQGIDNRGLFQSLSQGTNNSADYYSLAQGATNSANTCSIAQGVNNTAAVDSIAQGASGYASGYSVAQGLENSAIATSVAIGERNIGDNAGFAQGYSSLAFVDSFAQGESSYASGCSLAQGCGINATVTSLAQGSYNTATRNSVAIGFHNSAIASAVVFGAYNRRGNGYSSGDNVAFTIGDGNSAGATARHDLLNVFKDGRIVTYSSTSDNVGYDFKSAISSKLDATATGSFITSTAGLATETYVDSAVSGKLDASASSDFYSTSNPSGFITGVDLTDYATTAYVDSSVSGKLDETAFSTVSSTFLTSVDLTPYQLTADMSAYAYESSNSAKLDASASSDFYSTSNPSGFITGVDLSNYATTGYVDSSVSGKFDASASGEFYPSGNPSGFITGVDLTPYQLTADMSAYAYESSNSAKLDATAQVVTSIGVAAGALSSINGYGLSAGTANSASTALYDSAGRTLTSMATNAQVSSIAASYAASAVSSVSGDYYPMTSNPSGYLTTLPADLVYSADLSAYQPSGEYLSATESSNYYPSSNPSGFITGIDLSDYATTAYVDSSVSGKLDTTAFSDVSASFLTSETVTATAGDGTYVTSINGMGLSGQGGGVVTAIGSASSIKPPFWTATYITSINDLGFWSAHSSQFANIADEAYTASYDANGRELTSIGTAVTSTASASYAISPLLPKTGISGINGSAIIAVSSNYANSAQTAASARFDTTGRAISSLPGSAEVSAIASAYVESAVSGKFDASASGEFYPSGNPSGFITGVDLTPYQLTSDMSAYQLSGDYIYASALGTGEI